MRFGSLVQGNAKQIPLADGSVHCVVTSPPYYGLRDYSANGQIGLEASLQEYIETMVAVFAEVWRVLRDDGTVWLNMGDSYAGSGNGAANYPGDYPKQNSNHGSLSLAGRSGIVPVGLKPKDLMMVPHRLAIALQEWGWWVRSDIVWHKPNPMPESVTDRPTKAHEYIFLLSKSARYYYDADAVREQANPDKSIRDRDNTKLNNTPGRTKMGGLKTNHYSGRNKRSVWTITTTPYSSKAKISRLRRVAKDDVSDGMMHIVLPGCPEHGDQFVRVAREFYGGCGDDLMTRIERICDRLAQKRLDGSVPSDQKPVLGYGKQNSDSVPLPYSPTAIDHSNEIHKMALALGSNRSYIPFFEILSRIDDRQELLVSFVQHLCIYGNNILSGDFDASLSLKIPHRILDRQQAWVLRASDSPCECLFYEYYTKKPDHFATYPPELPEICIKAGTSEKGVCPECGKPWERMTISQKDDRDFQRDQNLSQSSAGSHRTINRVVPSFEKPTVTTIGWRPTCSHEAEPIPATVFDPFSGSGTTVMVANQLGRRGIGLDLSMDYIRLAKGRTGQTAFEEWTNGKKAEANLEGLPMWR